MAVELIAATAAGNGLAQESILARGDLEQIAVECARWALLLGRASFSSKAAFLAELRRALSVLDSQESA